MPYVRFEMEPEIHRRFKVWCFNSGKTMQGAFEEWVGLSVGGASKTLPTPVYEPGKPLLSAYVGGGGKASSEPITPPKQASVVGPVTEEEVSEKRCFKCKTKVREWTMTEKGPICPDCKSQMEVSIP